MNSYEILTRNTQPENASRCQLPARLIHRLAGGVRRPTQARCLLFRQPIVATLVHKKSIVCRAFGPKAKTATEPQSEEHSLAATATTVATTAIAAAIAQLGAAEPGAKTTANRLR